MTTTSDELLTTLKGISATMKDAHACLDSDLARLRLGSSILTLDDIIAEMENDNHK